MRPNEEKNSIIFSSVHVFTQPRSKAALPVFSQSQARHVGFGILMLSSSTRLNHSDP